MTESTEGAFCLRAAADDGVHPVLAGVKAQGRLDGLLFSLTLRQTYRNTSRRTLEVVYTFPLPLSAVLLGFAAEFSGRRVECEVMPRTQAEEVYENALADGDAPALLEAGPDGLYTANIGNLKRGEEVVLEIRFAQLVAFEQGRLRLAVPMTIAPRYGNPESSGLHAHQVPEVSVQADYPLELSVQVAGDLAGGLASGGVECPTHPTRCTPVEGGLDVALIEGARLDRDVVLLVTPQEARPQVLTWAAQGVALAAFELPVASKAQAPGGLALKLLVDCSGSMGGDSIASARRALLGVVQGLNPDDEVSFTRFGSSSELVMPPQRCTPQALEHLAQAVEATDASLGGTEMEAALLGVFVLPSWLPASPAAKARTGEKAQRVASGAGCADVLLITDGEVWDTQRMIASAQRSGHRVFVIGVGSSPAEAVLRHLAEATGGACEFATPGEALEAAASRMLHRMRQCVWTGLRVDWGAGAAPQWELPVPKRAFGGDTLLALAGFAKDGESATAADLPRFQDVRLLASEAGGQELEVSRISTVAQAEGDDLPRIAAARRVAALDVLSAPDDMTLAVRMDEAVKEQEPATQARALALQYRLIGSHTHGVLVHRRDEGDKPKDTSLLHRVQSMLAAGWGNTGRVAISKPLQPDVCLRSASSSGGVKIAASYMRSSASVSSLVTPSVWRSARTTTHALAADAMDRIEIPAFLRKQADNDEAVVAKAARPCYTSLAEISGAVADHLARGGLREDLPGLSASFHIDPAVEGAFNQALMDLRDLTGEEPTAWLLLALWIAQRPAPDGSPAMAAVLLGPVTASGVIPTDIGRAWQILERHLGGLSMQAKPPANTKPKAGRLQRLAAALSGSDSASRPPSA